MVYWQQGKLNYRQFASFYSFSKIKFVHFFSVKKIEIYVKCSVMLLDQDWIKDTDLLGWNQRYHWICIHGSPWRNRARKRSFYKRCKRHFLERGKRLLPNWRRRACPLCSSRSVKKWVESYWVDLRKGIFGCTIFPSDNK